MSEDPKLLRVVETTESQDLPAGGFSSWLERTRQVLLEENGADVPCGECNACCRSFQFIHISAGETGTLARIPEEFLSKAPGMPEGDRVLGYNENGHCPMLVEGACSIYEHRPGTCRRYDCRIFPAAGLAPADEQEPVLRQVRRWKFNYPENLDHHEHSAVQAAARFLRKRAGCFPNGVPQNPTQLAVLAIKVHEVFLEIDATWKKTGVSPGDSDVANAIMKANGKFEDRRESLQESQ
jgi:Fe-S-cluster containining protein